MSARAWLALALLALALLFGAWFRSGDLLAAGLVFVLPPLLLAAMLRPWPRAATFWSGVFALGWFSHGVMLAWSHPPERGYALIEVLLALVIIAAANAPALQARFSRNRKTRDV